MSNDFKFKLLRRLIESAFVFAPTLASVLPAAWVLARRQYPRFQQIASHRFPTRNDGIYCFVKSLICFFFLVFVGIDLSASKSTGTIGMPFLNMINDPRSVALGFATTGGIGTPASTYINPAGLSMIQLRGLSYGHTEWLGPLRNEEIILVSPIGPGALGISGRYLYDGQFLEIVSGINTGQKALFSDFYLTAAYGFKIFDTDLFSFSAGANFYWARESLNGIKGNSFGGSIGLQTRLSVGHIKLGKSRRKKTKSTEITESIDTNEADESAPNPFRDLSIGMTIRNLGSRINYQNNNSPSPLGFSIGVEYEPIWFAKIMIETDVQRGENTSFRFGIEALPHLFVQPRIGYNAGFGQSRFTTGFGFNLKLGPSRILFDYAIDPGADLGTSHWFSMTVFQTGDVSDAQYENSERIKKAEEKAREVYEAKLDKLRKQLVAPIATDRKNSTDLEIINSNITDPEITKSEIFEPITSRLKISEFDDINSSAHSTNTPIDKKLNIKIGLAPFFNNESLQKFAFLGTSLPSGLLTEINIFDGFEAFPIPLTNMKQAITEGSFDYIVSASYTANDQGITVYLRIKDNKGHRSTMSSEFHGKLVYNIFDLVEEMSIYINKEINNGSFELETEEKNENE